MSTLAATGKGQMGQYVSGDIVRLQVRLRDTRTRLAINPGTLTFQYRWSQDDAWSDPVTFSGSPTPAVGVIGQLGEGFFECWIDSTNNAGIAAEAKWISTGAGQATVIDTFSVLPAT